MNPSEFFRRRKDKKKRDWNSSKFLLVGGLMFISLFGFMVGFHNVDTFTNAHIFLGEDIYSSQEVLLNGNIIDYLELYRISMIQLLTYFMLGIASSVGMGFMLAKVEFKKREKTLQNTHYVKSREKRSSK